MATFTSDTSILLAFCVSEKKATFNPNCPFCSANYVWVQNFSQGMVYFSFHNFILKTFINKKHSILPYIFSSSRLIPQSWVFLLLPFCKIMEMV